VSSTRQLQENGRDGATRRTSAAARRQAAGLVEEADRIVTEVVAPGRWPQRGTVERFLDGDRLPRVLALYTTAMELDPDEPAYPWNLASTLNRLGLNELALAHVERAIRTASAVGDEEWSGAGAHLAWAEIAEQAGQHDVALVALARAKRLGQGSATIDVSVRRLRDAIAQALGEEHPEKALAEELVAPQP